MKINKHTQKESLNNWLKYYLTRVIKFLICSDLYSYAKICNMFLNDDNKIH